MHSNGQIGGMLELVLSLSACNDAIDLPTRDKLVARG